jgi:hypothetical protein
VQEIKTSEEEKLGKAREVRIMIGRGGNPWPPLQEASTTHQTKLFLALQWLLNYNTCHLFSLQKQALQKAQQSWHSIWLASAKSYASLTSIDDNHRKKDVALHQQLHEPETA